GRAVPHPPARSRRAGTDPAGVPRRLCQRGLPGRRRPQRSRRGRRRLPPMNLIDGVRQSTALTYLAPARARSNLAVRADALVDRIELAGPRAVGVRLAGSGEPVEADRVLLAAGAYGSPMILLRSGIGPADHLRSVGIDPVLDRPGVGAN